MPRTRVPEQWWLLPAALLTLYLATATRTAAAAPTPRKPMVAVMYFDYHGYDEELMMLRKGLSEMIGADLISVETIGIVERDRLQEVLAELDLQQTKRFDRNTVVKLGKLVAARYMVFGYYLQLNGVLQASAKLLDVETGVILYALNANGPPNDFLTVEQKLAAGLGAFLANRLPPLPPETQTPAGGGGLGESKRLAKKPPRKLSVKSALTFSKALDAKDKGNKAAAIEHLKQVLAEESDFPLAREKYDKLSMN